MNEGKDKTPEQITDEDYKVAPTSADEKYLSKKDRRWPGAKAISFMKKNNGT